MSVSQARGQETASAYKIKLKGDDENKAGQAIQASARYMFLNPKHSPMVKAQRFVMFPHRESPVITALLHMN